MELPDFLLEMSKQINTQDNRYTADPVFEVRYKNYIVTEEYYNEHHFVIFNEDGDALYTSHLDNDYTDLASYLFEYHHEWCLDWCEFNSVEGEYDETLEYEFVDTFNEKFNPEDLKYIVDSLPPDFKLLHMQEIEVTVNTHLTEQGAKDFIKRKQHDYPKLYTYATSLVFCEQMKQLRNWIKSLT